MVEAESPRLVEVQPQQGLGPHPHPLELAHPSRVRGLTDSRAERRGVRRELRLGSPPRMTRQEAQPVRASQRNQLNVASISDAAVVPLSANGPICVAGSCAVVTVRPSVEKLTPS